jgi:hypothetical protein
MERLAKLSFVSVLPIPPGRDRRELEVERVFHPELEK